MKHTIDISVRCHDTSKLLSKINIVNKFEMHVCCNEHRTLHMLLSNISYSFASLFLPNTTGVLIKNKKIKLLKGIQLYCNIDIHFITVGETKAL